MKFLILFCLSLSQLFMQPTYARSGGDVVGEGGGLSELYLTKEWKNFPIKLKPCLNSTICISKIEEYKFIEDSLTYKDTCHAKLKFKASNSNKLFETVDCGESLIVNSRLLYNDNLKPLPNRVLSEIGLQILFESFSLANNVENLFTDLTSITKGLESIFYWQELQLNSNHKFAVLKGSLPGESYHQVSYSCDTSKVDVTELINDYFSCDGINIRFEYMDYKIVSRNLILFSGKINLFCSGQVVNKKIRLEVKDDCTESIKLSAW